MYFTSVEDYYRWQDGDCEHDGFGSERYFEAADRAYDDSKCR